VVERSEFLAADPEVRVRFPALSDFLRCSGSATGSTQPREELLGRKSSGSGLESREYGCRDPSLLPRGTLYPQQLELTSPTSGCRSVGIARSRTQATEFFYYQRANSLSIIWEETAVLLIMHYFTSLSYFSDVTSAPLCTPTSFVCINLSVDKASLKAINQSINQHFWKECLSKDRKHANT
jgi:hypothetical protein